MFKEINPNSKRTEIMKKEFTPYELALVLKELGFDEPCIATYNTDKKVSRNPSHNMEDLPIEGQPYYWQNSKIHISCVTAPLYQQVFRWFREKYNLFNRPDFDVEYIDELDEFRTTYFFSILKMEESLIGFKPLGRLNNEKTYKEAELECLKKLIQIVKEQK